MTSAEKKPLILYPILFAASPVLHFFAVNKSELSPGDGNFLITMAIVLAATAVLWLLLTLILRNGGKAALITTLFVALFFSYGHVHHSVEKFIDFDVFGLEIGADKFLFSIWGVMLLIGSFLILKGKRGLKTLNGFLNVVAVFLIVISLMDIIPYEIKTYKPAQEVPEENLGDIAPEVSSEETKNFPDIYYIILDRYTNNINLQGKYEFDNSEFTNYLENKGFYVAAKSRENYSRSFLSLASSLNLKHLTYLSKKLGENSDDSKPVYKMLQDYEVWKFLKKKGYTFIHFGDWWSPTAKNRYADLNINYASNISNEFASKLLETTLYRPVSKLIFSDLPHRDTNRKRIVYKFEKLMEMPQLEGPKFVFVHLLVTHPPYVFDKDGKPITEEEEEKRGERLNYIESILYANQHMEDVIDSLIAKSEKPPIIIIQADEGHCPPGGVDNLAKVSKKELKYYMGILSAYYLPAVDASEVLYQDITPVNTFRIVFNEYFGTDYKLLEDRSYIFQDSEHLYKFIEVTDEIKFAK